MFYLGRLKQLVPEEQREAMDYSMYSLKNFYDAFKIPDIWMEYVNRIVEAANSFFGQLPMWMCIIISLVLVVIINVLKKVCDTLHIDIDFDLHSLYNNKVR